MVYFTTHQENPDRVPPSGGTDTDGSDAVDKPVWDVYVPLPGGGGVGGGSVVFGYIRCPTSEHWRAIYRNKVHYGNLSGGGAVPRSLVIEAAVVTGGNRYIGDTGGRLGGRVGNGLWGAVGR